MEPTSPSLPSPEKPDINLNEKLKPATLDVNLEEVENEARVKECTSWIQLYGALDAFHFIPMGSVLVPSPQFQGIVEEVRKEIESIKHMPGFDPLQEKYRKGLKEVLRKMPRKWKIRETVARLSGVEYVTESDN